MEEQFLETWAIHDRINLYLLDAIPEEAFEASLGKGRTVFKLFAHIHNVRLMWLQSAAPELLEGLAKLEDSTGGKQAVRAALEASGKAMATLLRNGLASGRIKGFKPHPVAFLGYCISHESHHRGQIGWTLKLTDQPLPKTIQYGLWEWGKR